MFDPDQVKLGRREPSNKPALMLARVLTGVVPEHPTAVDYLSRSNYGLYENDRYGDCGPTSVANSVRLVTSVLDGAQETPSQDDVFDLYRRSGNPNFDPTTGADDNGVDMQTMLEALVEGGIGGKKPIAFAKVDVSNIEEVRAAVAIFGFTLLGVDLKNAQQRQTVWDYVPRSGEWGGHAVLHGSYGPGHGSVVTWGEVLDFTDAFGENQVQEAWVVIWPEHLETRAFLEGVDITELAAAYSDLTGKTLPTPVVPEPDPVPVPTPPPAPVDDDETLWEALRAWWDQVETWARKKGFIS